MVDVKACRGADCDSDHFMKKVNLRPRVDKVLKERGQKRIKWDTQKLMHDQKVRERYQETLKSKLNNTTIRTNTKKRYRA